MKGTFRILIAEPQDFSETAVQILQQAGEVVLKDVFSKSELSAALNEYDVVLLRLRMRITRDVLPPEPRCRFIVVPTTGLDHIDLDACEEHGIDVISLRGEREFLNTVRATAEHTIALALSLIRKLPQAVQAVRKGEWERDRFRGSELYGKTAGIVGLGRLGTITASYFYAFGMRVIGYDVRDDVISFPVLKVDTIEELLEQSDLVSIHVNYTAETCHIVNAAAFARMKSGSILINTSRGGVVCETALLEALESGRLAGAALDVLEGEPEIDANHPVLRYAQTHSNVLITPHIGGNTFESFDRTEIFIANRLISRLRGQCVF